MADVYNFKSLRAAILEARLRAHQILTGELLTPDSLEQMTIADKQMALLGIIYDDEVTHDRLDDLILAVQARRTKDRR